MDDIIQIPEQKSDNDIQQIIDRKHTQKWHKHVLRKTHAKMARTDSMFISADKVLYFFEPAVITITTEKRIKNQIH